MMKTTKNAGGGAGGTTHIFEMYVSKEYLEPKIQVKEGALKR